MVPAEDVYAALSDSVALGVPFVQALVTRGPRTAELVERELGRARGPALRSVSVSMELSERLPTGLCERLLAVPVGRSSSGAIEVAAVDPYDPAVGIELAHQLGAPVTLVRVSLGELLAALERWLDERDRRAVSSTRTPAFGTQVVRRDSTPAFRQAYRVAQDQPSEPTGEHQSWPPIPLVRRSVPAPPKLRADTNPGVGPLSSSAPPASAGYDETGTEVIPLGRTKPTPPPSAAPPPVAEPALDVIDGAESAEDLVGRMLEVARPLAKRVAMLALRGKGHEVRLAHPTDPAVLGLRLEASATTVVARALGAGHFIGRLPEDEAHAELRAWLGPGEVYLAPVRIGERAPICLLLSELGASLESSRQADRIARRAEQVLERILREKKRGG